jgi:hypothetical protein
MRGPAVVNRFKAMQKTGSFIFTRLVTKEKEKEKKKRSP